MNNFQTILTAIFLAFFVFAVLIFSGLIKVGDSTSSSNGPQGKLVVWGTFPMSDVSNAFRNIEDVNDGLSITYVTKDINTYQDELVKAFAKEEGPDLFFITPSMIMDNSNFIYEIPYESLAKKVYTNSYIDGADIFLSDTGIMGLPVLVDPIVLYYNKNILSNNGIITPPEYWDNLFDLNPSLTKASTSGGISESMIALGQYDNITNSKDILATLLLQNSNSIVKNKEGKYLSSLKDSNSLSFSPVENVLNFFVEFANPSLTAYSWNRSFSSSFDMFTSNKLAFYLGRASELFKIQETNPNLSFDVTDVIQTKGTTAKITYGDIYAISVNKKSANLTSAFSLAGLIAKDDNAKELSASLSLPPVSRTLLKDKPKDIYLYTFYNSAMISRSWVDPDLEKTNTIFSELISNILSNKLKTSEALSKADNQINLLINSK